MSLLKNGAKNEACKGKIDSTPHPKITLPNIIKIKDFKYTPRVKSS